MTLRALEGLRDPLGTVWPALTEAVYLVQPPYRPLGLGRFKIIP